MGQGQMGRRWLQAAVLVSGLGGGFASAESAATGLAGLQAELNATGRVGDVTPRTASQIEAASSDAGSASRVPAPPPVSSSDERAGRSGQAADLAEEFRQTEAPVAACRIEVARRRRVSPNTLAAGRVTLRFTVEANGQVRNAEALSVADTDLEIAACAKRVLSERVFAKRPGGAITIEHTYRLGGRAAAGETPVQGVGAGSGASRAAR
jgi:hypothetical protein